MCNVKLIVYRCNHVGVRVSACPFSNHCNQQPMAEFGVEHADCSRHCSGPAPGPDRYEVFIVARQPIAEHECSQYCRMCRGGDLKEESEVMGGRETDSDPHQQQREIDKGHRKNEPKGLKKKISDLMGLKSAQ